MLRHFACLSICMLALLTGCADEDPVASQAVDTEGNEATTTSEIEELLDLYEKSVNEADTNLLLDIWVPGDDVSYVNPFQRLQSLEELKGFWENFLQNRFSQRELRRKNVSIHAAGDVAWAVFDWDFKATGADGQSYESRGWETQIYRMTDRRWRIAHVHYSVPFPSSQAPEK